MSEPTTRTLRALATEIRDFLERTRESLDEEIRQYPTPIPRCDAQFNHLYEQRARLARELDAARGSDGEGLAFVRAFVASAPFADSDDERHLRSRAASALAQPVREALR